MDSKKGDDLVASIIKKYVLRDEKADTLNPYHGESGRLDDLSTKRPMQSRVGLSPQHSRLCDFRAIHREHRLGYTVQSRDVCITNDLDQRSAATDR